MKTRIISGGVGLALLVLLLVYRDSIFFTVAVGLLSVIAVNEILSAIHLKSRFVLSASLLYSTVIPYVSSYSTGNLFKIVTIAYICAILTALVFENEKLTYQDVTVSFTSTLFVSYAFSTLIYIRDIHQELPDAFRQEEGFFYLILVLIAAWGSDTGAYFTGVFFGKHKLAPRISPKKTVEGLVGGLVFSALLAAVAVALFHHFVPGLRISYLSTLVITPFLALFGVLGDLTASVIKRNHGIKDFGKLIPGHGGVMDRFDSVSFIAPALYAILLIFRHCV